MYTQEALTVTMCIYIPGNVQITNVSTIIVYAEPVVLIIHRLYTDHACTS